MSDYISIPLEFQQDDTATFLSREQKSRKEVLDNLLEMIVFTPRGSFSADPDFGFEYANMEYANVVYRAFNSNQIAEKEEGHENVTRQACENCIKESLETYAPYLTVTNVTMELNPADIDRQTVEHDGKRKKKVYSRSLVKLSVTGSYKEGDLEVKWRKDVNFLIEPTVKKLL